MRPGSPYSGAGLGRAWGSPEALRAQRYRPVGRDFPVFLHPKTGEEYALARTERKVREGHQGFTFTPRPT